MGTPYRTCTNGGFTSGGTNAYDGLGTTGNTSTSAVVDSTVYLSTVTGTVQWSTSLTGMTAVSIVIAYQSWGYDYTYDSDTGTNGLTSLAYSWDGTTWYTLASATTGTIGSGSGTRNTYVLANFTSGTNLNALRLRLQCRAGRFRDVDTLQYYPGECLGYIYDVYADVSTGPPVYTVNTPTGPATLVPGQGGLYSTTVTNDSTNNCVWSVTPSNGSWSGLVNDATSSRGTWTPTAANTYTVKATSNLDNTKFATKTVTVAAPVVSAITGPTSLSNGAAGSYSCTVTNDLGNNITWTVSPSNGTFSGQVDDATNSRVNWTPSANGTYTLTATSDFDATKYSTLTVTVSTPTTQNSRPTTNNGASGFTNLAYAYDLSSGTATNGTGNTSTLASGTASRFDYSYLASWSGFPSATITACTLYILRDSNAQPLTPDSYVMEDNGWVELRYSINGGSSQAIETIWAGNSTGMSTLSYTIPAGNFPCNLNTLSVQAEVRGSSGTTVLSQTYYADSSIAVWDIYAYVTLQVTHAPILDHTAPGATGKIVYPSNLYSSATGTLSVATAGTPGIFLLDGTNGYWFYTGST